MKIIGRTRENIKIIEKPIVEKQSDDMLVSDNNAVDALLNEIIKENKIKVEIVLTQKQHKRWIEKGGEKWLKEILKQK